MKRNPLLERLDKVRQQEEYAKQLQKETENKEFNLVYDKVKEILPRAKELHELRKEFNYPQTAMNPFFSEYPEFCPYRGEKGEKSEANDIIWVKNGIGLKPESEFSSYVCVNYYDGSLSVKKDFDKTNEPVSKYKQEFVNSQLKKIAEKFDSFYQCEYAKLEYELKIRSQSSDAIIEKYKEKEQDLDDMEIEM